MSRSEELDGLAVSKKPLHKKKLGKLPKRKRELMTKLRPYESIGPERFYELADALLPVFERHFSHCKGFRPHWEVSRFLSAYDALMLDFWTGDKATASLNKLEVAIRNCAKAYAQLPELVRDELHGNAQQWDHFAKDRFLQKTKLNLVLSAHVPECDAEGVSSGLKSLAKNPDDFLQAIDKTRSDLPEGIPTRNRGWQQWALIEATVQVVRANDAMNVPDYVDKSGDLYRLLNDVFAVFGIKIRSFRQIFESWRDHIDSNRENLDLLSID